MDRHIPSAEIRRVWLDQTLTSTEAAKAVGLARPNLWRRAKALGLPPRPRGNRPRLKGPLFEQMWNAGVLSAEIAAHFGVSELSIVGAARRLGLARRRLGWRPRVTLSDFLQSRMAEAMKVMAGRENAALAAQKREP